MLVFLKLGGSLLTHKDQPRAARLDVLARLMAEVAAARAAEPDLRLVLGHGSGSFGHVEGTKYGTRQGVSTAAQWRGWAEVQYAAGLLNRLVVDAAWAAGVPVLNLPPSASAQCVDGALKSLAVAPVLAALDNGLVPLVFGDVALDTARRGTIVSTEDVFGYLAGPLRPARILLAGLEPGVLTQWPKGAVMPEITPDARLAAVGGAQGYDVTGGMASKVAQMQALAAALPGLEVRIFSGETPGLVREMLLGTAEAGTAIRGQLPARE
jgi:isopentenyl phosphate kinase